EVVLPGGKIGGAGGVERAADRRHGVERSGCAAADVVRVGGDRAEIVAEVPHGRIVGRGAMLGVADGPDRALPVGGAISNGGTRHAGLILGTRQQGTIAGVFADGVAAVAERLAEAESV